MRIADRLGRRGAVVLAVAVSVAVIGGSALAVVATRDRKPAPDSLVPVNPVAAPVVDVPAGTPSASPTEAPTPSTKPSPTATPAATETAAPTAEPTHAPSPTVTHPAKPTSSPAAPAPDPGMALVLIDNRSTVDARVTMNGGHWNVPAHTKKTVQVKPEPAYHDEVDVADAGHDGCGMADGYHYFAPDESFTLNITPKRNCYQGSVLVESLTWAMTPAF
jgi:hypothetical protein